MLDTHLPLSALKVQHSGNGDHQHTRNSPQRNSFENSNTDDYFRSYETAVPRLRTTTDQELGGIITIEYHQKRALVGQPEHELPSTQFEAFALGALPQSVSVLPANPSSADLGFLTTSSFPAEWLAELLNELTEIPEYAQEDDMAEPSDIALAKAKQLLEEVSICVLDRPEIYPMHERRIAIDFRIPERKSGVLFVIEPDGAGVLFHRTENTRGRLRVDDAADLLNEGGFKELKRVGIE